MKLAVIGGGSTYTPELVAGLAREADRLDLGALVLHESLTWTIGVGALLVLACVALVLRTEWGPAATRAGSTRYTSPQPGDPPPAPNGASLSAAPTAMVTKDARVPSGFTVAPRPGRTGRVDR